MKTCKIKLTFASRLMVGLMTIFLSMTLQGQIVINETQVIFDKTSGNYRLNTNEGEFYRFTPSISDVNKTDSLIGAYLLKEYPLDSGIHKYYRQYLGILKEGLEIVVVYFYCRRPEGFLKQVNLIRGGGECYLRARVNLKGAKVVSFNFNAPK